jgi:hypothetical protein
MVTGLWTNDRDTLAEGLYIHSSDYMLTDAADELAGALFENRVVRVLDPEDTELRQQIRRSIWAALPASGRTVLNWANLDDIARAIIEELRQP